MTGNPYRTPAPMPIEPRGSRWITWWKRLLYRLLIGPSHGPAARLARRAAIERTRRECAWAMRVDVSFWYEPRCRCGDHEVLAFETERGKTRYHFLIRRPNRPTPS